MKEYLMKKYSVSYENARLGESKIRKFLLSKSNFIQIKHIKPITLGPLTIISTKRTLAGEKEKLSASMKSRINHEGLFFDYPNSRLFIDFEDPTFYADDLIIGEIITHEPIITLYLSDPEKYSLEKEKIVFD